MTKRKMLKKQKKIEWKVNYDSEYYTYVSSFIVVISKSVSESSFRWYVGTIDSPEKYEFKHWDNYKHHIGVCLLKGKARTLAQAKLDSLDKFSLFLQEQEGEFDEYSDLQYELNELEKNKK